MNESKQLRCTWTSTIPLCIYHDQEWGVPIHEDQQLLEFLILEGAQAGLSWSTILNKRVAYREAFAYFDAHKLAKYDEVRCQELLLNPGIVRNRLKIQSTVQNARAFLKVQEQYGTFDRFIWQFVDHTPLQNAWKSSQEIPAKTKEAEMMSKELKRQGFNFVGPTICYAFMQAVGLVNDHIVDCFRWKELKDEADAIH